MKRPYYMVICKDDGIYVFATSRQFPTYTAAEMYMLSIAVSRAPIIVMVD